LSFDARQTITGLNLCINTFHVNVPSQPTVAETNSILAPFKAFFDSQNIYRTTGTNPVIGSRVLYWAESWWTKPVGRPGGVGYVPGRFNTEPLIIGATPVTSTVGSGGALQPPQLASVVSWRSAVSGRSGRGRTYLGNLAAGAAASDKLSASFVTTVNTAAATLITAVKAVTVGGASTVAFTVWSPTKGLCRDILSGFTDVTWDTMRSRVR
jgi:hypothetical protein